ncbi:VpsP family polysaccharide biosynthesis protein [Pseudoalteromonas aliena]|nr:VpsP family polysaccharide biosynthesis protein [Pseudoalteromonas aliena]
MINFKFNRTMQAAILAMVTLSIIYLSVQSMRANSWYFSARNTVQHMTADPADYSRLSDAKHAIALATQLEPSHPHYWQLSAHINMLTINAFKDSTEATQANNMQIYKEAEQALLKSVELRQSWAETWIALAQVVSYQEGASERVYEYIQQAKSVGPNKLSVHLGIIQLALINWPNLSPKFKALYIAELNLAVKHGYHFFEVFNLAKQVNRLPTLCLSLQFGNAFEDVRVAHLYKVHCK